MKPVVTRLYAVLVALTFVGLFAWAGADWYQYQQKAQEDGRAALRQAAGLISDLTVRHAPVDASSLGQALAQVTTDPRWKMVLLTSTDRGTEFYRGPRPAVPIDQAVPHWEPQPLSEVKVAIPVFRANGDPLVLEGIQEFYGRSEVFSLLKACGFTLVVLLVVTTVMVVLSSRRIEEAPAPEETEPFEPLEPEEPFDSELEETVGTLPVDDEYWFDDTLTLEDLPPLEVREEQPQRLRDGSELPNRLNEELRQALESHYDLSVILLSTKTGSVPLSSWTEEVLNAFSQDLTFEYESGVAVVLPHKTLEEALKVARSFLDQLDEKDSGVLAHAGVASRSGRALVASTLLAEAASARRRSLAGTVRVLGLKIDPERYREQMAASASA